VRSGAATDCAKEALVETQNKPIAAKAKRRIWVRMNAPSAKSGGAKDKCEKLVSVSTLHYSEKVLPKYFHAEFAPIGRQMF
jgi:hypothetical protein